MSKIKKVYHKKSNVVVNGAPKLPTASQIDYGELAINYAPGVETLSIKNSSGDVVTFSSDTVKEKDERVIAEALNDLNSRLIDVEHDIPENVSDLNNDSGYVTSAHTHSQYATTAHTHTEYASSAHTHTAAEVGAMATSERSNYSTTAHTHSQYATTAHTHTASEVGAMATSERSNYATTAHTHSEYASSAHTHTAAEVGAMATSERSNYATTAHTHTASEVGAMAISERSNYSTTGHTHSEYATTADTANFITSADTGVKFYDISASTIDATGIYDALPQNFRNLAISDIGSGITPVIRIHIDDDTIVMPLSTYSNGELLFVCSYYNQIYTFRLNSRGVPYYIGYWMPTEASISDSGFTKNALTGVNVNGTPATVTGGVADVNVQGLPAVTAADNGKVLMVVNGAWALVTPSTVYTGSSTPDSQTGNDGDIYLQTD